MAPQDDSMVDPEAASNKKDGSEAPSKDNEVVPMTNNGSSSSGPMKRDNDTTHTDGDSSAASAKKPKLETAADGNLDTNSKPDIPKKRKKKAADDATDDMAWICAECKEAECMMQPDADQFLLCDGQCHRVFHYPCAGLAELPQSDDDWICKDCSQQQHECAFCHEYGADNVDVFPCRKGKCGLFFHESCLAMYNVEVTIVKSNGDDMNTGTTTSTGTCTSTSTSTTNAEATTVPVFTCPAHTCWTCTQKDAKKKELDDANANAPTTTPAVKTPKKKRSKKKKQPSIYQCKTENRLFVSSSTVVHVYVCVPVRVPACPCACACLSCSGSR
jgi:hypothetical protein